MGLQNQKEFCPIGMGFDKSEKYLTYVNRTIKNIKTPCKRSKPVRNLYKYSKLVKRLANEGMGL
jgi:hypothetical protein